MSAFSGFTCTINSLHLPQGGMTIPYLLTATILRILLSPKVIMLPIALYSAQNPIPQSASTHTPTYVFPLSVTRALPTPPACTHAEIRLLLITEAACRINSSSLSMQFFDFVETQIWAQNCWNRNATILCLIILKYGNYCSG